MKANGIKSWQVVLLLVYCVKMLCFEFSLERKENQQFWLVFEWEKKLLVGSSLEDFHNLQNSFQRCEKVIPVDVGAINRLSRSSMAVASEHARGVITKTWCACQEASFEKVVSSAGLEPTLNLLFGICRQNWISLVQFTCFAEV